MLRTYPEVMSYRLEIYANNDFIAETDTMLTRYIQPSNMSPMKFAQVLKAVLLRCGEVYDECCP